MAAILDCFCTPSAWKKKNKENTVPSRAAALRALHMKKLEQASGAPLYSEELKSLNLVASPLFESTKNSPGGDRVSGERLAGASDAAADVAYEGEDEHEENASIKREFSDFDLQAKGVNSIHEGVEMTEEVMVKEEGDGVKSFDMIQSGHVSDPGAGRVEFWASPRLMRSCSNLERRDVLRKAAHWLRSPKSHTLEEQWELSASAGGDLVPYSPASVMTHRSADRVMLKKHSSSQLLPSASRKLWWKLFLWSHRNLQKTRTSKAKIENDGVIMNQRGGYYSDTLEPGPNRAVNLSNMESPGSFTELSTDKSPTNKYNDNSSWDGFHTELSGLWQQKQWIAFPAGSSSSFNRVNDWVRDLETEIIHPTDDANGEEIISFPPSPDNGKSPVTSTPQMAGRSINLSAEILHANTIIQSLNPSSTVAYMSGTGLKVVPVISGFSSLKSVDLSNNFIVHITPGSLPKGLHVLNLSRNKINTIEGLRELTRLRVLDLSYNRISRIGHGLSNCTLIKELYLAGNKISDVEGLHRLLKLTVLDLSFNKITTTKALGQLVANYNSLLALNLLGNPIQSNISDDHLRKAVSSLFPKLTYLNKQPIKPQSAREALTDSVAKAALGGGSSSSRRRAARRVSRVGSVVPSGSRSSVVGQRSSKKSKGQSHRR